MASKVTKTRWSSTEDDTLREAVASYPFAKGAQSVDWKEVSVICGRTTKQCRERWVNVLDPSIRRTPWSREEILALFEAQRELGNKWSTIAARLPGRPETAVKNVFHAAVRREKRRQHAQRNGLPIPAPFHECMADIPNLADVVANTHAAATQMASDRSRASRKRLKSRHHDVAVVPDTPQLGVAGNIAHPYTVFTSPDASQPCKRVATGAALGIGSPQPRFLVVNCPVKVDIPADPLAVWLGIMEDPSVPKREAIEPTVEEVAAIDDFLESVMSDGRSQAPAIKREPTVVVKTEPVPVPSIQPLPPQAPLPPAPIEVSNPMMDIGLVPASPCLKRERADSESDRDSLGTLSDDGMDLGSMDTPAQLVKFTFGDIPFKVVAGPGIPFPKPGDVLQTYETESLKVEHPSSLGMDSGLEKALSGIMVDLPPEDDFSWFTTGDALPSV